MGRGGINNYVEDMDEFIGTRLCKAMPSHVWHAIKSEFLQFPPDKAAISAMVYRQKHPVFWKKHKELRQQNDELTSVNAANIFRGDLSDDSTSYMSHHYHADSFGNSPASNSENDNSAESFVASATFANRATFASRVPPDYPCDDSTCANACSDSHSDFCTQEDSASRPIKLVKCGDLDTGTCMKCNGEFNLDEDGNSLLGDTVLKVKDNCHAKNMWCHIHCWDANNPSAFPLFSINDGDQKLNLFQSSVDSRSLLLEDWRVLECSDRLKVLQHMIYKNFVPNPSFVTMDHVV